MTVTGIIITIIVGAIIGALGRLAVPGRQPIPVWLTIVVAIVAGAFGYSNASGGIPWVLRRIDVVVAAIGVVIAANVYARRGRGAARY